jgi:Flp pilus assembly protein TadG
MTTFLSRLRHPFARFIGDERGTIIAEGVISLPILLWGYVGLFVYWDAFRSLNTLQKAAYTISDMISRENPTAAGLTSDYVVGMDKVLDYLINTDANVKLRVSSVTWSDTDQKFEIHWSRSPYSQMPELTTDTLQAFAGQIPTMTAGDYVIIVEVTMDYTPAFNVGIGNQTFSQFIVTRPRFIPCIPMDTIPCPVT